jgi:hypothetical protein
VWRPSSELREGLAHAGKAKFGGEVIEKFLDVTYQRFPRASATPES